MDKASVCSETVRQCRSRNHRYMAALSTSLYNPEMKAVHNAANGKRKPDTSCVMPSPGLGAGIAGPGGVMGHRIGAATGAGGLAGFLLP